MKIADCQLSRRIENREEVDVNPLQDHTREQLYEEKNIQVIRSFRDTLPFSIWINIIILKKKSYVENITASTTNVIYFSSLFDYTLPYFEVNICDS